MLALAAPGPVPGSFPIGLSGMSQPAPIIAPDMEAATTTARSVPARRVPDPAITIAVLALLSLALLPLEIHRAFGLPAHPLLIHAPVILIPVLSLALLAVSARPTWCRAPAAQRARGFSRDPATDHDRADPRRDDRARAEPLVIWVRAARGLGRRKGRLGGARHTGAVRDRSGCGGLLRDPHRPPERAADLGRRGNKERASGIEPEPRAWKARMQPLHHARNWSRL